MLDGNIYRVREGSIRLPAELADAVEAVLGLDNRPQAQPHFRAHAGAANTSYTPVQVAQLYQFPQGATAAGQTIGIIELGGGYRTADLTAYFKGLGLKAPKVTAVSVDDGKNTPGNAERCGWRGHARYRSVGGGRARGKDRRLLRAQYRPGVHRCHQQRGARYDQQTERDFDQLGRAGVQLDRAGDECARRCMPVRCRARASP